MYPAYITKPLLPPLILLLTLLTMITQWHGNMPTYMVTNRWLKRRCYDMVILLFAGKYCHCLQILNTASTAFTASYAAYTANNDYTMAYMPTYMVTNRWLERRCYDMDYGYFAFCKCDNSGCRRDRFFSSKTQFPSQTGNFCLQHVMHLLRDMPLRINLSYPGKILVHPMTRQIFCNTPRLKCYLYLSLCHKKTFAVK